MACGSGVGDESSSGEEKQWWRFLGRILCDGMVEAVLRYRSMKYRYSRRWYWTPNYRWVAVCHNSATPCTYLLFLACSTIIYRETFQGGNGA